MNIRIFLAAKSRNSFNISNYSAAGDFNAKHTLWSSRVNTSRGIKGVNANKLKVTPSLELSFDHTPIIIEYTSKPILYNKSESLYNKSPKWQTFNTFFAQRDLAKFPAGLKSGRRYAQCK